MKQVLKIIGLAVKYMSIITVIVEVLQFAKSKLEPFAGGLNVESKTKENVSKG